MRRTTLITLLCVCAAATTGPARVIDTVFEKLEDANEHALELYAAGDLHGAAQIYLEAFMPSSVAPVQMWRNYAWILSALEKEDEAKNARQIVYSLTSFQALLNLHEAAIPIDCPVAKTASKASVKDGSLRATWQSPSSFDGPDNNLIVNMKLVKLPELREGKVFLQVKVFPLVPGDRLELLLPYREGGSLFHFRTVFELDFHGSLCHYPFMYGEPVVGPDEIELKFADILKRSLTGYLGADSSRSYEPVWDIHFSNIRSLANWSNTPKDVLTSTHVGSLNAMQEMISDIVDNEIPGDMLECGVFKGGMSIFMTSMIGILDENSTRKMWCADTFAGIPPRPMDIKQSEIEIDPTLRWMPHAYNESLEAVLHNFRKYHQLTDNVGFLVGNFADTLPHAPIEQLSILRIDADTYYGTKVSLEQMYGRLSKGGYVVIDDFHLAGARRATVEFRSINKIVSPLMPIPVDLVYACSPFEPTRNVDRLNAFVEDIIFQRGDDSLANRLIAPQAVYWKKQ
jgi:hypothetical protein